jgi:hypothetical protein
MEKEKEELIEEILAIELDMFLSVRTIGKANCQEHPKEFQRNRRAQFSAWSPKTLESYLDDLEAARDDENNLMTMKYARMANQIPCLNDDPFIDKIVDIQRAWQADILEKYPYLMRGGRVLSSREDSIFRTSFETYLRGELETYSKETLHRLYEDMQRCQRDGINMNEVIYNSLAISYGFSSAEEAESALAARQS